MTQSRLRTIVGVFVVVSHFGLLFLIVALTIIDKFTRRELFTTLGLMLPLFATYTTAVVKSFLASQDNPEQDAAATTFEKRFIALFLPSLPVAFILTAIAWKAFGNLDFDNFSTMIGLTEIAFGIYVGAVMKALFAPVAAAAPRGRRSSPQAQAPSQR